ncbi:MAG: YdiU family protein [Parvularculaceae bacterium]
MKSRTPSGPYQPSPVISALGGEEGAPFYDVVSPAEFPASILRYRNDRWAGAVGLSALSDADWVRHFARFEPLAENLPEPLALRYHGHQFRTYNPDIGDGRGFLFAQLRDGDGRLLDLATKGSGLTPYSRTADGRLTLKGGVREVLATAMLEALGVYTSKTFSLIETGESLHRGDEPSPTRSAVLVRLGHSHVRFGTFQRLAYEGDAQAVSRLVDYCIRHFDPDLEALAGAEASLAFFERVIERTARLAAEWMAAGFVHGVLNSDNMNVTGESFDYGPWRFLPATDFSFTAAYFDHAGLYAYGRQPDAAMWNLSKLGGALTLVAGEAALNEALEKFPQHFERSMTAAFFARLGVAPPGENGFEFVVNLLQWMEAVKIPFERVFFDWFCGMSSEARAATSSHASLYAAPEFSALRKKLKSFEPVGDDRLAHEYFAGEPVTMLIDEVEAIWAPIAEKDDWSKFGEKLAAIEAMRAALDLDASRWERRGR